MTKEQFKKFAKEEFGYDISFEKSDEPDTYESLFGSCKGCEHAKAMQRKHKRGLKRNRRRKRQEKRQEIFV